MAEVYRVEIEFTAQDRTGRAAEQAQMRISAFERQVRRAQAQVDRMTRRPWRVTISAFERVSPTLERITGQLRSLTGRAWRISIGVATAPLRALNYIWSRLTSIQGLVTAWLGGQAFRAGVLGPLGLADRMQRALIGFETFLGSRRRAMDFLAQLQRFAAETPFEMLELLEFGTQLLPVFKGRTDMVMRTLQAFGDAAAMTGAGIEGMSLALLGFRQIATMGKLSMEELRQVTENLLIPLEPVIEELGIAKDQLKDLGKMNIPAERAMEAILRALERPPERGGFLGGMAKQMSTLANQVSRLRDVLINTFVLPWGTGLAEGVANALGALSDWFERNQATVQRWSAALREAGEALSGWFAARIEGLMRRLDELLGPRPVGRDVEVLSRGRLAALEAERRRYVERLARAMSPEGDVVVLNRAIRRAIEMGPRTPEPPRRQRSLGEWSRLAWDRLIVEPFEQWWGSGGQEKVERIAGRIGGALGSGISSFLATALGIAAGEEQFDSPFAQAGASAGRAFTEAFAANIDTDKIASRIWEAAKGIFRNAAEVLPGGPGATAGSWLSALLAGWMGLHVFRFARHGYQAGRSVWMSGRQAAEWARSRFGRRPPEPPSAPQGRMRFQPGWEVLERERPDRSPFRPPSGWEVLTQRPPFGEPGRRSLFQRLRDWLWRRRSPGGRVTGGGRIFRGLRAVAGNLPGPLDLAFDMASIFSAPPGADRVRATGNVVGSSIGGAIGAALGSLIPIPGVGTAIGGIAGSWVGGWIGERVAQPIADFFRRMLPGHVQEGMAEAEEQATTGVERVTSALGTLPTQAEPILSAFPGLAGTWLGPLAGVLVGAASGAVGRAIGAFSGLPGGVGPHLAAVIGRVQAIGPSWFSAAAQAARQLVSGAMSAITSLPGRVGGILSSITGRLQQIGSTLFARARDAFSRLVQGYRAGMDEHSPSYIERSLARVEGAVWSTIDSVGRGTAMIGRMAGRLPEYETVFPAAAAGAPSAGRSVAVTVQAPSVSLTVQVTGGSAEAVLQAIRAQSRQIAKALADDIALEVARAVAQGNMATPAAMA